MARVLRPDVGRGHGAWVGLVWGGQHLQPQAGGWMLWVGRGTDKGAKATWHMAARGPPTVGDPCGLPEPGQVGVGVKKAEHQIIDAFEL